MAVLSTLVVKLTTDVSGFQRGLKDAQGTLGSAAAGMKSAGATLTKSVTLPLAAIGAGAIKAASDVDEGLDTIRVGTGATGEALAALEQDFKGVAQSVPASLADVGTAIADLNTRTGQTGEGLQQLASQTLELARLQGTDLGGTIESTTRLFGDWAVATEDQSAALDTLFKASQQTGVTVDKLSQTMVQFGAPLREVGFSMEEAAALMGKFEKEGVNLEVVMSGVRTGLGKMARSGEEPIETFRRVIEQIENAGSAAEANSLAFELFGARAGVDMARAISEGRFSVDELVNSIRNSEETILGAAASTEDFSEKWKRLTNVFKIAAAPLGDVLIKALEALTPHLTKAAEFLGWLLDAFGKLPGPVQAVIVGVLGLATAAGPVLSVLGAILPVLGALLPALAVLAGPVGLVVAAIVGFGAALVLAWKNSETFRNIVTGALNLVKDVGLAAFEGLKAAAAALGDAWNWLVGVAGRAFGALRDFFGPIAQEIRETIEVRLIQPVKELWARWGDDLMAIAEVAWEGIKNTLGVAWTVISAAAKVAWDGISNVISTAWEVIKALVGGALDVISNTIQLGLNIIQGDWSEAWDNVKGIFAGVKDALLGTVTALWNGMKTAFSIGADAVRGILRGLFEGIAQVWNQIKSTAITIVKSMWDSIRTFFSRAIAGIREDMDRVAGAVIGAWSKIKSVVVGGSIVPEMWALIVEEWDKGAAAVVELTDRLSVDVADTFEDVRAAVEQSMDGATEAVRVASVAIDTTFLEIEHRMEVGKERLLSIWDDIRSGILGKLDQLTGGIASKIGGAFEALDGLFGGKIGEFVSSVGGKLTGGLGGVFDRVAGFMGGPWGAAIMSALDVLGIDIGAAVNKIIGGLVGGIKAIGRGIGSLLGIGGHSSLAAKERELFGVDLGQTRGGSFTDSFQEADARFKALTADMQAAMVDVVLAIEQGSVQLGRSAEGVQEDWRAVAHAFEDLVAAGASVSEVERFFQDFVDASRPLGDQVDEFIGGLEELRRQAVDTAQDLNNVDLVPVGALGDQMGDADEAIREGFDGIATDGVAEFTDTFEENLVGGVDDAFGEMIRLLDGTILSDLLRTLRSMAERSADEFLRTFAARIGSAPPVVVPSPVVAQPSTGGSTGSDNFFGFGPPRIDVTVVDDRPIMVDGQQLARIVTDEQGKFLNLKLGPTSS